MHGERAEREPTGVWNWKLRPWRSKTGTKFAHLLLANCSLQKSA